MKSGQVPSPYMFFSNLLNYSSECVEEHSFPFWLL
jgi:hypothetical protein